MMESHMVVTVRQAFHSPSPVLSSRHRSFGLTNVNALRDGGKGLDCRGEEHAVELVWSVRSGKTRVFWNGRDISNLFRDGNRSGMVEFAWNTRTEESLRIVAHAEPRRGVRQYDLLVDGISVFNLPKLAEIGQPLSATSTPWELRMDTSHETESRSPRSSPIPVHTIDCIESIDSMEHQTWTDADQAKARLASVGLALHPDTEESDDLHSDLYSPIVNSMRNLITAHLPQTEETVSRAFTNALIKDSDSYTSESSLSDSSCLHDAMQIEVNALWETFRWVRSNADQIMFSDGEELQLEYMREQIEAVFAKVCHECLTPGEASRILLHVGAILGLKFHRNILMDTILVDGLSNYCTVNDLEAALRPFGRIVSIAMVQGHGFGCCRFVDDGPLLRLQRRGLTFTIAGTKAQGMVISSLHEFNTSTRYSQGENGEFSEEEHSDQPTMQRTSACSIHGERRNSCGVPVTPMSEQSVREMIDFGDEHQIDTLDFLRSPDSVTRMTFGPGIMPSSLTAACLD
jgi:hypothetical protein